MLYFLIKLIPSILESIVHNEQLLSSQNENIFFIINSLDKPIINTFSTLNLLKKVGIIFKSKKLNILSP